MGFGDVLDAAFSLFRKSYTAIVLTLVIVEIPAFILQMVFLRQEASQFLPALMAIFAHHRYTGPVPTTNVALQVVPIVADLLNFIGYLAVIVVLDQMYRGGASDIRAAYRQAGRRFWAAFAIAVLVGLSVLIGFVVIIIPGIVLFVYFSQALFLGVLDKERVFRSLGRSWRLVRGRFWRIIGIGFVSYLLYATVAGLVSAILLGITAAVLRATPVSTTYFIASSVLGILLQTLLSAFPTTALYVQFMDLRVRREGLDLTQTATTEV